MKTRRKPGFSAADSPVPKGDALPTSFIGFRPTALQVAITATSQDRRTAAHETFVAIP